VAAAVLGLLTVGVMIRQRNLALRRQNEAAARAHLRHVAKQVLAPLQLRRAGALRPAVIAAGRADGVREVVLLRSRPASPELDFVREVHLVAHSDERVQPGSLRDRGPEGGLGAARAKGLYDWSARVRTARGTDVRWRRPADGAETIEVGRVLRVRGESYVIGVRWAPVIRPPAVPLGWVGLALLLGLLLPLGQRRLIGSWRWLASGAGIALMAAGCGLLLAGYHRLVELHPEKSQGATLLGLAFEQGVPEGGVGLAWGLVTAAVMALPLLGWRGVGHRIARNLRDNRVAYAYIVPAALGMIVLVLLPFMVGLVLGFFNHCDGRYEWVGLGNFAEILSGGGTSITDPLNFWFTLGVTLAWTTLNVFLHVTFGLALALLLKDPLLHGKGVYRVLLIIPWAVPNYITALMWKGMFHQQFGAVNQLLGVFGLEGVSWFSHFWSAFTANVVTNTWLGFPFMMVVCLGALQSIPSDLYEAAEVDGASKWYQFSRITLPLLKPALLPAVILGSIWTFNQFNIIYLVSGGEPAGSTDILITEAYRWAFIRHERYGLAAAYATLIFLILLGYTLITNRISRGAEGAMDT
jgi:ABC-type sugar transport system permease subunit